MPLFFTSPDCQKNTHSNEYGSKSFGQFFGASNQEHLTRFPLAFIEPETSRCRYESRLLQVFRLAKHHAWKYIAILDETYLYFSNHFDWIWLPHDELPPSFPKQTIAGQKLMITVA
jgi:hypothetical protein